MLEENGNVSPGPNPTHETSSISLQSRKENPVSRSRCLEEITNRTHRSYIVQSSTRSNNENTNQQYGITVNNPAMGEKPLGEKLDELRREIREIENSIEDRISEQQGLIQYIKYLDGYIMDSRKKGVTKYNSQYFNEYEELRIVKGELRKHDLEWIRLKKTLTLEIENNEKSRLKSQQRIKSLSCRSFIYSRTRNRRIESLHR